MKQHSMGRHGGRGHRHGMAALNRRRMALLWVIVQHGINEANRLTDSGIPKEQWAWHLRSVTPKLLFDQSDGSGLLNDFLRQQHMMEITGAPQLYRSAEALRQAGLMADEFTPTESGVHFIKGYLDMLGTPAQWPFVIPVEGGKPMLNKASFVPVEEDAAPSNRGERGHGGRHHKHAHSEPDHKPKWGLHGRDHHRRGELPTENEGRKHHPLWSGRGRRQRGDFPTATEGKQGDHRPQRGGRGRVFRV